MKHYLIVYAVTLIVLVALDLLWLGGIARDFYKNRIGDQLQFNMPPGAVFYLLYAVGIVVFVNGGSTAESWKSILLYGAFFGIIAYGTYDLTNWATLKFWTPGLAMADMAWGSFATAVAATCGWLVTRYIERM